MDEDLTSDPQSRNEPPLPLEPDPAPMGGSSSDRNPRTRAARVPRPWEALERLDRQWVDSEPLAKRSGRVVTLAMTTSWDPDGWDYLSAMTGVSSDEVARACAAWLEAQLAADATLIGRSIRPTVALVPAGQLWYVVRTVAGFILVIDGPGFLTPLAAAIAASRRYEAELLGSLERDGRRQDDAAAADSEDRAGSPPSPTPGDDSEPAVTEYHESPAPDADEA